MNVAIRRVAMVAAVIAGLGAVGAGCLTRPVEHADPDTKTDVKILVPNQVIDKVDLLFDIDNSASMGDKQLFLTLAFLDLIDRLIIPVCVDTTAGAAGAPAVNWMAGNGCTGGFKPEFQPVHDMHLGIVSSSLGQRLSEPDPSGRTGVCFDPLVAQDPFANLNAHMDDKGHLIGRSIAYGANGATATEGVVTDAAIAAYGMPPSGFLYWYPRRAPPAVGPATPIADPMQLQNDFAQLVTGVGTFGCGIESQLESWYRFLVQPDPYETLALDANRHAQWQGVDSVILKERHDFLRPDSLVAVVVLSDENDSEIDVRSVGGLGDLVMQTLFVPPHGTTPCLTSPLAQGCHS